MTGLINTLSHTEFCGSVIFFFSKSKFRTWATKSWRRWCFWNSWVKPTYTCTQNFCDKNCNDRSVEDFSLWLFLSKLPPNSTAHQNAREVIFSTETFVNRMILNTVELLPIWAYDSCLLHEFPRQWTTLHLADVFLQREDECGPNTRGCVTFRLRSNGVLWCKLLRNIDRKTWTDDTASLVVAYLQSVNKAPDGVWNVESGKRSL
jgi:hypothetical protein